MKKWIAMFGVAVLAVGVCFADTFTTSAALWATSAKTNSVVASGWLDKIEIGQTAAATCTVVLATYDQNGTAIDTLASSGTLTADTKVIRPRAVGTSSDGTALTPTAYTGVETNMGTVLNVPYERVMIGGNAKVVVTGLCAASTNDVTVTVFFEPLKK